MRVVKIQLNPFKKIIKVQIKDVILRHSLILIKSLLRLRKLLIIGLLLLLKQKVLILSTTR